jgi:hypothetical protein
LNVNGDGFLDIVIPEIGNFDRTGATAPQSWANQVLINTGTGKFVQAMWKRIPRNDPEAEQLLPGGSFLRQEPQIHSLSASRSPAGLHCLARYCGERRSENCVLRLSKAPLGTGPNGTNPALQRPPGFSEYLYLTEYPDVAAAVATGQFASGLAHYPAIGRSQGREAFVPNATIRGSDQVTLSSSMGQAPTFR